MSEINHRILTLRRALWHVRKGGLRQLAKHRRRVEISAKTPEFTQDGPLSFPDAQPSSRHPLFHDLRVATILDEFSQTAWGCEFQTVPVTPQNWRDTLTSDPVHLLLVESAWKGNDGAWQYQLTGSKAPSTALHELVEWCRSQNIPTVFWNKEDPPHLEDFLGTAALFDAVFTSDSRLIPEYQKRLGHDRVAALPFAAQDALHNPIRPDKGYHSRDVAFAGMYFAHKYPERREQMDLLLGAAESVSSRMDTGLEIFSRFLGDNPNYQFPEPFDKRVIGSLPYSQMMSAYKAYKVFLNVNSVTDSPSMCARRIFEISASGTPVITTPSAAIPHFFTPHEVPVAETQEEAAHLIRAYVRSPELNARTAHLAQRAIWKEHTYSHRAVTVLDAAGLTSDSLGRPYESRLTLPTVSALMSTNRPDQVESALRTVSAFQDVDVEVCLLSHGFDLPESETRALARDLGIENLSILSADSSTPLGGCLNRLIDAGQGDVFTKIDDDDIYGPQYLADLLRAKRFSGADLVGKQAHYMHLAETDATLLRFAEREHRWTDFIMGPTITGSADLFRSVKFPELPRGEDSGFLERAVNQGAAIYSSDRFNFCQMRRGSTISHTWNVPDHEMLGTGTLVSYGLNSQHFCF
jgi:spore maturation protein CgeB